MPKTLAIIYARGSDAELEEQDLTCMAFLAERGYTIVYIAHDAPGQRAAWDTAQQMLRTGKANRIIFTSVQVIPCDLESVTGTLPSPFTGHIREATRRTRLIPRW